MNFKEWFILNEMPHMKLPPNKPINGIIGDFIDFRAEDRSKGLQSGNLVPNFEYLNFVKPWIAKTKEGWLVYDGIKLDTVSDIGDKEDKFVKLPPDWWRFATVIDGNNIVKKPEWPRENDMVSSPTYKDLKRVI